MRINPDFSILTSLSSAVGYVGLGVLAAKLFTLISFVLAASILNPEQIGIYSYTLGAFGLLLCYQAGSISPLLIERQVFKNHLSIERYLSYSHVSNMIMVSIAGLYLIFESPQNNSVIFISLAMMLNGLASVGQTFFRASLVTSLNFRGAALFDIVTAATQCGVFLLALFIIRDETAYAFSFLGLFFVNLSLLIWGGYFAKIDLKETRAIFSDGRYLIASAIFGQGTFFLPLFLVSRNVDPEIAGQFYFASQLIMAFGLLAQKPIQSAILPLTKKLQERSKNAVVIMNDTFTFVFVVICFLGILLGIILEDIILFIWNAKWAPAASIIHFALIAIIVKVLTYAQIGLLDSKAHWKIRGSLSFLEFFAVLFSCLFAINMTNSLTELAFIIFISHCAVNLLSQCIIANILGTKVFINVLLQISFALLVVIYA